MRPALQVRASALTAVNSGVEGLLEGTHITLPAICFSTSFSITEVCKMSLTFSNPPYSVVLPAQAGKHIVAEHAEHLAMHATEVVTALSE